MALTQAQIDAISKQIQAISAQTKTIASQVPSATKTAATPTVATVPKTTAAASPNLDAISAQVQKIASQIPSLTASVNQVAPAKTYSPPATPATTTAPPAATPAPASTDYQAALQKITGSSSADPQTALANYIATMTQQAAALPQTYQNLLGSTGLTAATTALGDTNQEITKTQALIDNLESNINSRIQSVSAAGGGPVTEAQRERELATEQKPLTQQLQTEQQTASTQQAGVNTAQTLLGQQWANAQLPLQTEQSLLPAVTSLAEYQSPQDILKGQIALEQAKSQIIPAGAEQVQGGVVTALGQPKVTNIPAGGTAVTPAGTVATGQPKTSAAAKPKIIGGQTTGFYSVNADGTINPTPLIPGKGTNSPQVEAGKTSMLTQLETVKGADGFISPSNYRTAKDAWVKAGLAAKDFDNFFSYLANPNDPGGLKAYGLK
jgi:hypothetical protein